MMTIMVMVVMMICVMKWKLISIRFVFFGNENIGETFQYDDLLDALIFNMMT